jgi:hypothetical protein
MSSKRRAPDIGPLGPPKKKFKVESRFKASSWTPASIY